MKGAGIALLLLLTAASCGSGGQTAQTIAPTPTLAAASPSRTAASPSPAPTPTSGATPPANASVTVTAYGRSLSCRLPVIYDDPSGAIVEAGFVDFPGGTLERDPSAPQNSFFYDRAYSKWLPVNRNAVSPDGTRYAYGEGNVDKPAGGALHVVEVSSGRDTVVYRYSGNIVYAVLDYAAEGIYLTAGVSEGRSHGLWLLKFDNQPPHLINSTIRAPMVGAGVAWGVDFNSADPNPATGGLEGPENQVLRVDLAGGTTTPWFYRPGTDLWLAGADASGRPFVSAVREQAGTDDLWLVESATAAEKLFAAGPNAPAPQSVSAIDRHGVWLDGNGGDGIVWLFAGGSIRQVATVTVDNLHTAGGCIP